MGKSGLLDHYPFYYKNYTFGILSFRGGDTSMAGMAIAIPGVSNISKTGDTMGKIR